ncbi:MAG: acyl-CoA dehydrogenase family protein [Dehalococcoidia bacterium]
MDLSLTPEQEMLKAAVRRFVEQEYPKETLLQIASSNGAATLDSWQKLAATGWLGILIPSEYGGEGGSFTDAAVLFEELGRGPVPGPHISSYVLGALTVLEGGTEEQKRDWLPPLVRGDRTYALAVTEEDYSWDPAGVNLMAHQDGEGLRLNGTKAYVFDAADSTHLLCAARSEDSQDSNAVGLVAVAADAPGVNIRPLPGFAWNLAEVKLENVTVESSAVLGPTFQGGWEALQSAIAKTIPVLCAYLVGGCQQVYEMSVDYSRTRIQFGTPIGRFQRVQDHIIDLVNQLDAARWTAYEALWKLDAGKPATDSIHLAKAVGSDAYYQACTFAHEVHAGVGSMTEYGLTLHTTASRTLYHYLGDPRYHRRRLADVLAL